jgi:hypothetical protein
VRDGAAGGVIKVKNLIRKKVLSPRPRSRPHKKIRDRRYGISTQEKIVFHRFQERHRHGPVMDYSNMYC